MADEAELKIKPVLAGNGRGVFRPLERGLRGVADTGRRVAGTIGGAFSKIASIQGLITGGLMYGAGKTFYDMTLGAADNTAMAEVRMKNILGTSQKWEKAQGSINDLLFDIPSLDKGQAIGGMESFLSVTKGAVGEAEDLVKISGALSSINPGEGLEGAMFSLKELIGSGDTASLRDRFGIRMPTQDEAKKAAKKAGVVLEKYYKQELLRRLAAKYGEEEDTVIDFLLGVKRDSIGGQLDQIKSVVSNTFESIGKEARKPVLNNISQVAEKWTEMAESPQFKGSISRLSEFFADSAGALTGALPGIIDKIPGAMQSTIDAIDTASDFYNKHPGLVKFLGGAAAANWLSGGMLTQAGGSVIGRLGGGSGAGAGLTGGMGKCCCDDGGSGDSVKKLLNKKGPSAAAAASSVEALLPHISRGALSTFSGSVMAAIPAATGIALLKGWSDSLESTAEKGSGNIIVDQMASKDLRRELDKSLAKGDLAGAKMKAARFFTSQTGRTTFGGSEGEQGVVDLIDSALAEYNIDADLQAGQSITDLNFSQSLTDKAGNLAFGLFGAHENKYTDSLRNKIGRNAIDKDHDATNLATELNSTPISIENLTVQANSPEEFGKEMDKVGRQARATKG